MMKMMMMMMMMKTHFRGGNSQAVSHRVTGKCVALWENTTRQAGRQPQNKWERAGEWFFVGN